MARWEMRRFRTLLIGSVLVLGVSLVWAVVAPSAAVADAFWQPEYGQKRGDLIGLPAEAMVGDSIVVRGSGFEGGSTVDASLMTNATGVVAILQTVEVDDEGNLEAPVLLSEGEVEPGSYTVSVTGRAVDGGSLELSAPVRVVEEQETADPAATESGVPSTTAGSGSGGTTPAGDTPDDVAAALVESPDNTGGGVGMLVVAGIGLLFMVAAGVAAWRFWDRRPGTATRRRP